MIIVKTRFGRRRLREQTLANMWKVLEYLFAHYGWCKLSDISEACAVDLRTLECLAYIMWSMRIVDYRERVFKNKQKYLFSVIEIRLKRIKGSEDMGYRWYKFYKEDGKFDKKKYYEEVWGKRGGASRPAGV